ncbi:MAG TPA: signal recognition particle-docking protein FtsY [Peptococcaceae bacterium]|nr:signal recognition particle-docking protein FtsY [Peptococcaceae bacterium]HPZ70725.1 signal recognition particle-docking protein FtsY [Peptococcaceae bacterium]HQD53316.1 signal recognition particle-docking protein FtsY [Peptococcaceae bacterium]
MGLFGAIFQKVAEVVSGKTQIDEELFEELEETLITADVGVETSVQLVDKVRERTKKEKLSSAEELQEVLKEEIALLLSEGNHQLDVAKGRLNVILVVGVNGVGKTTTIGKLGYSLKQQGYKVMVAAADTFRAAAIEQLQTWCQRGGLELIHHHEGADPAAVVYDALQAAQSRKVDVLLIDTAGRLQTKTNLMEELKKIRRIIDRESGDGLREVLLVLDATTGQNALSQARLFSEATGVTGVILTKTDGTAKGGVILGIQNEYKLPVKYLGFGETIDSLREFIPEEFSASLLTE